MILTNHSPAGVVATVGALVVCPLAVGAAVADGTMALLALAGVAAMAIAAYIGLRHPLWLYWAMAAALGLLPFGYFPGVRLPLFLPLAFGVLLAAVIHPGERRRAHPLVPLTMLLVFTSLISLCFTYTALLDVSVFVRWAIATLTLPALLTLSRRQLAMFGRIFVYASTVNALFGVAIVVADPENRLMRLLAPFGYTRVETARFVFSDEGRSRWARLGGTWVDPNAAGIAFSVALVMAITLFVGARRTAMSVILLAAILLTLSRAAIFSLLVGAILLLLFHGMKPKNRQIMLGTLGLLVVVALAAPFMRRRILSSFGSDDAGAEDRGEALAEYPGKMAGHWIFGQGWGRREFIDGDYSFVYNMVANAPLIAIYRGGLIVGTVFLAILVFGCVLGCRKIRSTSLPNAWYGAVFIGFVLVALQLDHPVIHIPQVTMAFAVFLAFLTYTPDDGADGDTASGAAAPSISRGAGPPAAEPTPALGSRPD